MMTKYDDRFVWFGLFGFVQVLVFVWFAWFDLDRLTNREFKFSTIQCGWVEELEIMIANTVTSGCHCHHDCCQPQAEAEAYDSELP